MDSQVIILAAGQSSRFYPFNHQHKSLTPVCGQPILAHTLHSVAQAGTKEAIIVVSPQQDHQAIRQMSPPHLQLQFAIQAQPLGQANAILSAQDKIKNSFFVINHQHFTFHQIYKDYQQHIQSDQPLAATLRCQTNTPQNYGVFKLEGNRVIRLVEKPPPDQAPSNWRLAGIYYFDQRFIQTLAQTPQDEYQLETALDSIADSGQFFAYPVKHPTPSLKYPWDLLHLKNQILESLDHSISKNANIVDTAIIKDKVVICSGAIISDHATIEGPAYIGRHAIVGSYSLVRKGTVLEAGAQLQRYCDASNSHILPNAHIHSGFIGDSVIGQGVRIGAGFITANRRLDRQSIQAQVKDQLVDSNTSSLGCFIGPNSKLGIRVSTMPGTILGPDSLIGPGIQIKGTHPANSTFTNSNL